MKTKCTRTSPKVNELNVKEKSSKIRFTTFIEAFRQNKLRECTNIAVLPL